MVDKVDKVGRMEDKVGKVENKGSLTPSIKQCTDGSLLKIDSNI